MTQTIREYVNWQRRKMKIAVFGIVAIILVAQFSLPKSVTRLGNGMAIPFLGGLIGLVIGAVVGRHGYVCPKCRKALTPNAPIPDACPHCGVSYDSEMPASS